MARIRRASPGRVGGRAVLRAGQRDVRVRGSFLVYGNNIEVYSPSPLLLQTVLCSELPSWWEVGVPSTGDTLIVSHETMWIAPLSGRVLTGADVASLNERASPEIDISSSHPFSIWAGINIGGDTPNDFFANAKPAGLTRRLVFPCMDQSGTGNPTPPVATFDKPSTLALGMDWSGTVIYSPDATPGGEREGVWIEMSYLGPEQGSDTVVDRTPIFLVLEGVRTDGSQDWFLVGDISAYAPWRVPYACKIAIAAEMLDRYVSPTIRLVAAHDELGSVSGLVFSRILTRVWSVDFRNMNVALPFGDFTPGRSVAGLQGESEWAQ